MDRALRHKQSENSTWHPSEQTWIQATIVSFAPTPNASLRSPTQNHLVKYQYSRIQSPYKRALIMGKNYQASCWLSVEMSKDVAMAPGMFGHNKDYMIVSSINNLSGITNFTYYC